MQFKVYQGQSHPNSVSKGHSMTQHLRVHLAKLICQPGQLDAPTNFISIKMDTDLTPPTKNANQKPTHTAQISTRK